MVLRINHNIPAIQAHRNLSANSHSLGNSLERISSGAKVNRASDAPAALMISEQMRSQIAGVHQAIDNSETAVSMIQTTEASMGEIGALLLEMRQLAIYAANEGVSDTAELEAIQREFDNAVRSIDRIVEQSQFGNIKLLDGSNGVLGNTNGANLKFVGATTATGDSRVDGFEVKVSRAATKSQTRGTRALTNEIIDAGEQLHVIEDGKMATYVTNTDDTPKTVVQNLQSAIDRNGLHVEVRIDGDGKFVLRHRNYGSSDTFQASSMTLGILSESDDTLRNADIGRDIRGTINGEYATGKGQILTGTPGSSRIAGLQVLYTGNGRDLIEPESEMANGVDEGGGANEPSKFSKEGKTVGLVYVSQNSPRFQVGSSLDQMVGVSIGSLKSNRLGRDIANASGFRSLADVDLRDVQGAQDTLLLVDAAMSQVTEDRGKLGAFQKNTLENNLSNLRASNENLISSESIIRDADMAAEMATYMKEKIKTNSAVVMMAQANQQSENVGKLLV